jgi:5-methylcytosine-specific restriction enzyme subunit McrC
MQAITAFEHQSLAVLSQPTPEAIDAGEADSLSVLGQRLPGFCDRRYRSVKLANFCGLVRIGSRLLEVLPKIDNAAPPAECRGVLLNLLRRASDTSVFRHVSTAQHLRQGRLIEAFIEAFFDAVASLVRGGLLRQYQEHHDDLRLVRGRVVAKRQFGALANRQDVVACSFDELTADNTWNRLIKAGLRAVKPWIWSVRVRRRWTDLLIAFDDVTDVRVTPSSFSQLPVDRQARRYLHAAEWARRILSLESPALRSGAEEAPGLLFDMNRLWEHAVGAEFGKTLLRSQVDTKLQDTGTALATVLGSSERAVPLRPDLTLWRSNQLLAIADAKWKRPDVGRAGIVMPSRDDVYQMHAYAAAFGCEHMFLVYPWHEGLGSALETTLELPPCGNRQPRLSVICIDIAEDRFELRLGGPALGRLHKQPLQ